MNEPASTNPIPPQHSTRARRRRARRAFFPSDAEGQTAVLAELARRSYPSFELFIYAILSGAILAAGYLLDSQAVLIFGVLAAPLLTPWVGLSIAAITGSLRFFLQTLAALLVSAILVFVIGLAAGFANTPFEPRTLNEIHLNSRLWPPELAVLAIGAILLVVTFVRTEDKPYLPSVVLAYAFYLPVSAAGFGRRPHSWHSFISPGPPSLASSPWRSCASARARLADSFSACSSSLPSSPVC
jgi:hypothetical protein